MKLNRKKLTSRNSGFGFIELIISTALIALVLLAMSSIYLFAVDQFHTIVRKNALEEDIMMITYYLKSMLSQSDSLNVTHHIDTRYRENRFNRATLDTSTIVKEFICNGCNSCGENRCSTGNDDPVALAIFSRQTGYLEDLSIGGVDDIEYSASAFFLEPPILDKPGRLHIVYAGTRSPSYDDNTGKTMHEIKSRTGWTPTDTDLRRFERSMVFDNIISFNFEASQVGGSLRASSVSVSFALRHYKKHPPKHRHTYCSHQFEPGCSTRDAFWDIESSVNINLKNNHVGDLTNDRGKLYFYKMIKPPKI